MILTRPRNGYERLCEWAVETRIPAVQLRTKGHDEHNHLFLAQRLRQLTKGSETLFIVNDSPEIAMKSEADGLHIGQQDLAAVEARRLIGPSKLLGLSTHNLRQVIEANNLPVDYIGFGPLFETTSKENADPATGPEKLREAFKISKHPIVAIGGLDLEHINDLCLFAHNVAVIRAVSEAHNPRAAMSEIHEEFLRKRYTHRYFEAL